MGSTREAALALCEACGLPYAEGEYRHDAEGADGPHLVLRHEGARKLVAGGRVHERVDQWSVTLYSARRDEESELAVEAAFDACGIVPSDPYGGYDDESRVKWVTWDFEVPR